MATPKTSPKSARMARAVKPKAKSANVKSKAKAKAKSKPRATASSKPSSKTRTKKPAAGAKTRLASVASQARKAAGPEIERLKKAAGPEIERLKKASIKVEARLKEVSAAVATKLAAFEDIAEQQLKSEKTKARIDKIEKDVSRLLSSADQQFGKVRGALDEELKEIKVQLEKSAEKVIPAAKERIAALVADQEGASDTWEFYTDKAGKWRWRLKGADGKNVGASNQAFKTRAECTSNAKRLGYRG